MNKRFTALLLILFVLAAAAGCGKKKNSASPDSEANIEVKEEITQFVNETLPSIQSRRDKAIEVYDSYFADGSKMSAEEWLTVLQNDSVTGFESYLEALNQFEAKSTEVQELKSYLVQMATNERDAVNQVVAAISNTDAAYLSTAEDKMKAADEALSQYKEKLTSYCRTYGIIMNGSFDPATDGDAEAATEAETQAETEAK